MFPYRVKYTESEYDIQNNNLLYKIDQQCQNTFEHLKSKSTVYPPRQTRTDVSGHAIETLNWCASFIKYKGLKYYRYENCSHFWEDSRLFYYQYHLYFICLFIVFVCWGATYFDKYIYIYIYIYI